MADPSTLGMIGGIGSSIVGGIMSAQGARQQGKAAQQMGLFQAGIASINAGIARQNANYIRQQGEVQAQRFGMGAKSRMADIVSAQGASGLDVGSGSSKMVQDSFKVVSDMDMAQIRANAAKAAYDYDIQAQSHDLESIGHLMGVENAKAATRINVMSSIVGSASSVADKWMSYSRFAPSSGKLFGFGG